ncbi:EamA family transporter, partial [Streptomyces prunicolor]|uniref:EamA family transporter n=1 Tax=Streptomyces prunicolor TaxID=67348 RepID=UPI0033E24E50
MASRPALTAALTALAPISWGTTYAVTTQFLPPDRPLFTGLMRALPAGLVLLALARVLPRGAWWWKATVLGALNIGAFFPLLFLSAYRLPGGMAAVVGSVGPLIVVGLSAGLLGQRPTARSVLTGAVAVEVIEPEVDVGDGLPGRCRCRFGRSAMTGRMPRAQSRRRYLSWS